MDSILNFYIFLEGLFYHSTLSLQKMSIKLGAGGLIDKLIDN